MKYSFSFLSVVIILVFIIACTYDRYEVDYSQRGYPQDVGDIIVHRCAVSGCHNNTSKDAVAGLSLETWNKMFEGARGGATIIPYRPDFSTLIYYVNTYDDLGSIHLLPTMPVGKGKLSHEEVKTLYDWILKGAPDVNGKVKFADVPNNKKIYVANRGCDEVTVFDAKSGLAMRYVKVGNLQSTESPQMIKVAPNNQFWCVSFRADYFQKFSISDNSLLGQVDLGFGSWNSFVISPDSKTAYIVDWHSTGKIVVVDLETMTIKTTISDLVLPLGSAINNTGEFLYVTSQMGNFVYKIKLNDINNIKEITLDNSHTPTNIPSLDPHEILFSTDGSKYFVTCQKSNEVRIMQASNDSLLGIIPVGTFPQEMDISKDYPYLFVSCTEDISTFPGKRSSVYVVNYQTNTVATSVYAGHQSYGVAVDDINKKVFISNRNISTDGPAPHHNSVCSGRNGYVTAIDLNSLQLIPKYKPEVSVDPYGIGKTN